MDNFMMIFTISIAIIVFATSCIGLGYLSGFWVRRKKWPSWVSILMWVAISLLWPVILVGFTSFSVGKQESGLLAFSILFVVVPIVFILSFILSFIGLVVAYRMNTDNSDDISVGIETALDIEENKMKHA